MWRRRSLTAVWMVSTLGDMSPVTWWHMVASHTEMCCRCCYGRINVPEKVSLENFFYSTYIWGKCDGDFDTFETYSTSIQRWAFLEGIARFTVRQLSFDFSHRIIYFQNIFNDFSQNRDLPIHCLLQTPREQPLPPPLGSYACNKWRRSLRSWLVSLALLMQGSLDP